MCQFRDILVWSDFFCILAPDIEFARYSKLVNSGRWFYCAISCYILCQLSSSAEPRVVSCGMEYILMVGKNTSYRSNLPFKQQSEPIHAPVHSSWKSFVHVFATDSFFATGIWITCGETLQFKVATIFHHFLDTWFALLCSLLCLHMIQKSCWADHG